MLPFWLSIGLLSLTQGAVVALPGMLSIPWLQRRRSRLWAAIPPLSVIAFVFVARAAEQASAQSLTYLALVAVPVLATLALGWLGRGARLALALLAPALFALAWADRGGLGGQAAALALSALSCVALGVLLAAVTPPRWLAAGIVLMACADAALVASELLQHPNNVLNAAHPVAGLPRLQAEVLGSAAMGYGDLFVAGLLGGLLAQGWPPGPESPGLIVHRTSSRVHLAGTRQIRAAVLVAGLALAFDLLFFTVNELPATVPVALGLILVVLGSNRKRGDRVEQVAMSDLKPQVYVDERSPERFERYYEWASSHGPDWVYTLARLLLTPLCMVLYRARCVEAPNVPRSGPAILAPNHFSSLDHFFCAVYLRRRVCFMAKSQLFRGPLSWILRHGGAFPVQRGRHDERAIATALAILDRGGVVVIYPEGGRSRSGRIGERARPGVGRLALESGAPVVAVAIHGSERARNWKRLELPQVTVRYGEPIRYERLASSTREDQQAVADATLEAVRELYEGLERPTARRPRLTAAPHRSR